MATFPGSGQASTADFISTFGAPASGNTGQMYRGGSYVPDISANNSVPTSGAADSADYYGTTDYVAMSGASLNRSSNTQKAAALGSSNVGLTSLSVTASVSGGTGNYTYTWEKVSGTTLTINSQGSATTTFSRTAGNEITTSVYRCKITDGVGTIYTGNYTINFYHYQLLETIPTIVENFVTDPQDALCQIMYSRNGTVTYNTTGVASTTQDWVRPKRSTVGDDFDLYVNDTSVSGDNGNFSTTNLSKNTATTINANRTLVESRTSPGQNISGARIRIRAKGGGGYVYDDTVSMRATVGNNTGGIGSIVQFIDTILQ